MTARVSARDWGWQHASRTAPAVAGLDLEIEPGERVLLLGPSGAGKSTLLAGLAGVLGDVEDGEEHGSLLVNGVPPATARGAAGLVLQDPQANTILGQVGDDVAFGCENLQVPRAEIWLRVRAALDAVGLDVPLDRSTAALSGGERQRLALAGVLAMRPGLLLLDEPTANLDPAGVVEVRDAVERLLDETGATLVVVEHRVDAWLPLVDRVVVLEPGGGVLADGAPEAIFAAHGHALAARGVWVPGHPIELARSASPGEPLVTASELVVGRAGQPVLGPLDHTLRAGESTVVLGPNGAGKSTFALTVAGLLEPVGGAVVADPALRGRLAAAPIRWRSSDLATRIGTVFQEPEHQFVARSVVEEVRLARAARAQAAHARSGRRGGREGRGRAAPDEAWLEELLDELGLSRLRHAHPFTLSGGEQRRLSVATVLAAEPRVIVLDEPTFGQDRATWTSLVGIMARLVDRGSALLSVTHDRDLARIMGDRVLHVGQPSERVR